jgi:DNA repair protein RecN (Recombination protein N)
MLPTFYLKTLTIQNFATFRNQVINFKPGLNVIIGETGSGKSLVLDALQLILGSRADKKIVRKDTDYSLLEAIFHCEDEDVKLFLESEGYPIDGSEIIVKRLIYKNGTTKTYINHLACTVSFLSQFSRRYIDLVGQFENQKLLSDQYQLKLLDHFGQLGDLVNGYSLIFKEWADLKKNYEQLLNDQISREQRLDYLNFQIQEIELLNPSSQDEVELSKKKNLLINLEKNQKLLLQINAIFEGEEKGGLLPLLSMLQSLLGKNQDSFSEEFESLTFINDQMNEIYQMINKKFDFEVNPEELEGVLDRLDIYQKLKKKFGGSVEAMNVTYQDFIKERSELQNLEENLCLLQDRISTMEKDLQHKASILRKKRLIVAKKLSHELTIKIRELKMNGATIDVKLEERGELGDHGIDRIVFSAETNPGEGYFKVKDVASGGELSRILLAIRQILSHHSSISIFLFDEIDTGIGGETAICIGKALSDVAINGQVISITHLPQIAQFADSLILVNKDIQQEQKEMRTESFIREIYGKAIQKEVRSMALLN